MLSSGQLKAENRVAWAMSDLTRATAVAKPQRGSFVITDLGSGLLHKNPHVTAQDIPCPAKDSGVQGNLL